MNSTMHSPKVFLLAAVVSLASCALIPTPHTIGDVGFDGCVFDEVTLAPVSGATLMIAYPAHLLSGSPYKYVGSTKSNESGCFVFKPVPEFSMLPMRGPVNVHVYANGYKTRFLPLGELAGKHDVRVAMRDARIPK